jgi:hypothetical protein
MDLARFISFLSTKSLYLSRLCDLSDKFEGHLPPYAVAAVDTQYAAVERQCGREPGDQPGYADGVVEYMRSCAYVNCWCMHEHESEAMWRIDGREGGVAVRTTFQRRTDALPETCHIGCIRYVDYSKEPPSLDNYFNLATHKRHNFSHEREVRIVLMNYTAGADRMFGGTSPPHHMIERIDLASLEEIRLSPYAERWMLGIVSELVSKYDCPLRVVPSEMSLS